MEDVADRSSLANQRDGIAGAIGCVGRNCDGLDPVDVGARWGNGRGGAEVDIGRAAHPPGLAAARGGLLILMQAEFARPQQSGERKRKERHPARSSDAPRPREPSGPMRRVGHPVFSPFSLQPWFGGLFALTASPVAFSATNTGLVASISTSEPTAAEITEPVMTPRRTAAP